MYAHEGIDTHDAYQRLGVAVDPRTYERAAAVLREMGASRVRLLTNNPRKVEGLRAQQFEVERVPLQVSPTPASRPYLDAKRDKLGHWL
jgi:GTP cyclohydrolase II